MSAIDLAERLATDALAGLAGAGICTPAEGYLAAPYLLSGDIAELVTQRDSARAEVEKLRGVLASAADLFGALGANLAEIRAGIEAEAPCLAPELLAALVSLVSVLRQESFEPDDLEDVTAKAEVVIRKATGGER